VRQKSYGDGLAIQSGWANPIPEMPCGSDLAISYDNVANVRVKQADLADALTSYRRPCCSPSAGREGQQQLQAQKDLQFSIAGWGIWLSLHPCRDIDDRSNPSTRPSARA